MDELDDLEIILLEEAAEIIYQSNQHDNNNILDLHDVVYLYLESIFRIFEGRMTIFIHQSEDFEMSNNNISPFWRSVTQMIALQIRRETQKFITELMNIRCYPFGRNAWDLIKTYIGEL